MLNIANYQIIKELHTSSNSVVYRAKRRTDDWPVVLKVLRETYPPPSRVAMFKREFEIIRDLDVSGVIKAYSLETDQQRWLMVLEDIGGLSLSDLMREHDFVLDEWLALAIQLVNTLGQIHQRHIIHKDINPSNIIVVPPDFNFKNDVSQWQIKIIDFGISMPVVADLPASNGTGFFEGTAAYISPEQTGRMNRSLDYRTDFYSLGVTLYELLTGRLPFESNDTLELVHCHIAKQPIPPHQISPDLPPIISKIILKLLAKNAKDRYQSAYGLKVDLTRCLRQLQTTGRIDEFPLGRQDISDQLRIPEKLYGRHAQIQQLFSSLKRVCSEQTELVLVSGYQGVGKTALVQEFFRHLYTKTVDCQPSYLLTGQFIQEKQETPYVAFTDAFQSLVRQLLVHQEVEIAQWREKLLEILGDEGQVLIEIIPELELLLEPQPDVPLLPPMEAKNRLSVLLQRFVALFTRPEAPLVIFLDNVQWADKASLEQLLMLAYQQKNLLLILAYRDNVVSDDHPLLPTLDEVQNTGTPITHIMLSPLGMTDMTQLISDTLSCELDEAKPLAETIREKTNGNPYFIGEFLRGIHRDKLIDFNAEYGHWEWNLGEIRGCEIMVNVAESMASQVEQLLPETQAILIPAACMGKQFDLRTLSIVAGYKTGQAATPYEVTEEMWEAIATGLVLPLSELYKLMGLGAEELPNLDMKYKFAHKRVQEAFYALLPPVERSPTHWEIGRLLWQQLSNKEQEEYLFIITDQLNQGRRQISTTKTPSKEDLLALNMKAGHRARAARKHERAFYYFNTGIELLEQADDPGWEINYEQTLIFYTEAAEVAVLQGNFDTAEQLITVALKHVQNLLDKARFYEIKLRAAIAQHQLAAALIIGQEILAELGIKLPDEPSRYNLRMGIARIEELLANKPINQLVVLPEMTDPWQVTVMRILSNLSSAAYLAAPKLFPLVVFRQIEMSIKHGNTVWSIDGYASYGSILCGKIGNIETGYQFGQLALTMLNRFEHVPTKTRVKQIVYSRINPWKTPLLETLPPLEQIVAEGFRIGETDYAAFALLTISRHAFLGGETLPKVAAQMDEQQQKLRAANQKTVLRWHAIYWQTVLNLLGENQEAKLSTVQPWRLVGPAFDEERWLPQYIAHNDERGIFSIHCYKLLLCYLFGQYAEALENANAATRYLERVEGMADTAQLYLYDSLVKLALYPSMPSAEKNEVKRRVQANQVQLLKWTEYAPANYHHMYHLVAAEEARILNNHPLAREHYYQAITMAESQGHYLEEALANELAGVYYLNAEEIRFAVHFLSDAHYLYRQWGAMAKVRELEQRYPQLIKRKAMATYPRSSRGQTTTDHHSSGSSSELDLTSVIKATQTISSEIDLDKLLIKLITLVIENAGAQQGCLLLVDDEQLFIEAEGSVNKEQVQVLQSIALESNEASEHLLVEVANYVARTRRSLVLGDASREGSFTQTGYILKNQPKSILCTPLINHGELLGLIYLENNLMTEAFSAERVEMVNFLGTQATISITNAKAIADRAEQDRLRLQNEFLEQQSAELARLNADKDKFFSIVAHDLKSPFQPLLGLSEMLPMMADSLAPDDIKEMGESINRSAKAIYTLLENLLEWSRMQMGRMAFEPTRFNLTVLVNEIIDLLAENAHSKKIDLRHNLSQSIFVLADRNMINAIIRNLVSNALKFTPREGKVTIDARYVPNEDSSLDVSEMVELYVTDTGVGIGKKNLDKLFKINVTYTTSGTEQEKGTGLGLILSQEMVKRNGGTIWVESELGTGTAVKFTLPKAEAETATKPEAEAE